TVDVVVGEPLEQRQRPRPGHVELAERGEVEEPSPLAHRAMLGAHALEEPRPRPAPRALIRAGAPPGRAGLEIVRPLPAVLLAEHGAGVGETRVERARPAPAGPLVLVVWVPEHVVVPVRLDRKSTRLNSSHLGI